MKGIKYKYREWSYQKPKGTIKIYIPKNEAKQN